MEEQRARQEEDSRKTTGGAPTDTPAATTDGEL